MSSTISSAIRERRTTVLFDKDREITDDQINELVQLATRAPTAFNLQNWRFIAVRTPASKSNLRALAWDQAKITDAPVTFIIVGELADANTLPDRLKPAVDAGIMPAAMVDGWTAGAASLYEGQPWRQRDEAVRSASFAAATMFYAAHEMGLGSGPMIGFDPVAVAQQFGLSENEVPVVLVAVGYGMPENWPQKPRRPLSQILSTV